MGDEERESGRCGFPGGYIREAGGGWGSLNLRAASIHRFFTLTASQSVQHPSPHSRISVAAPNFQMTLVTNLSPEHPGT